MAPLPAPKPRPKRTRSDGAASPRTAQWHGSAASRRSRRVRFGFVARRRRPGGRRAHQRRQFARGGGTAILAKINPRALDAARIGVKHFGLERLRSGNEFSAHRDMPGLDDEIAAE